MKMVLNTDGGARGNPGPGAIGVILRNGDGEKVFELGKYIGKATNNEAEYQAVIAGLQIALEKNASELLCKLDSELVVKQLNGLYKVKDKRMKEFWSNAKAIEKNFKKVEYTHVPRSENSEADEIVNKVLDDL